MKNKEALEDKEVDIDVAVVETAAGSSLSLLLPQLRITCKLADFEVSAQEAQIICDLLKGRSFLDGAPVFLAEDMADELIMSKSRSKSERRSLAHLADRIRALAPSEAFLLYAATTLYWAVEAVYPQVSPADFMRVEEPPS